jgi:GNAT superfamily N-acetyltransferase
MEIRLVRPSEYDAVGELTAGAYVGDGYIRPSADYARELRNTAARAVAAEVWVAVEGDDERILGSVTSCPAGSPWKELAGDGEGEFRMLAVAAHARGRGIGEALVRHCIELSKAAGDHGMALSTMDRMTGAHRVYGRLGFQRSPQEDWSPVSGVLLWAFRLVY